MVHFRHTLSAVFKHAKRMDFYVGDNPVEYLILPGRGDAGARLADSTAGSVAG